MEKIFSSCGLKTKKGNTQKSNVNFTRNSFFNVKYD
jgi:hypothetical protein